MGEFFRVTIQNFLQGDAAHGLLRSGLYQVVTVPQNQLNIYSYTAGGVGMGILVKQWLVPLHCPIRIQQRDLAGLFRKSGARVNGCSRIPPPKRDFTIFWTPVTGKNW